MLDEPVIEIGELRRIRKKRHCSRSGLVCRHANTFTEGLIYFMVVFSPWAFGTTQPWSIWTMNVCGYLLGACLLTKWIARPVVLQELDADEEKRYRFRGWTTKLMALLTIGFLWYCLTAALNARAEYNEAELSFNYFPHFIPWLPHSYEKARSLEYFWMYLAIACAFWGIVDWLTEERSLDSSHRRDGTRKGRQQHGDVLPPRFRRLLWVLAVNGSFLAIQGLVQRVDGGAKLLWVQETRLNREALSQFGPYAYRSNAAQYLNLLWPAMLALWWWLEDSDAPHKRGLVNHRTLLPMTFLVAICPLVSLSRAGAIVSLLSLAGVGCVLLFALKGRRRGIAAIIGGVTVLFTTTALYFDGGALLKRFERSSQDLYQGREITYKTAAKMLQDYPVFGTGPGTYEHVFQLYRKDQTDYWPAQLHNDWLETTITFGWVGFGIAFCALLCALGRWFIPGGVKTPWAFPALLWISIGGCLIHARVDFPFQIYSVLFLAIVLCAFLFSSSKRNGGPDFLPR